MSIKKSVLETIGKTPLIEIDRFKEATNIKNNLYTKVEFFNPGGSVKDRVGLNLIKQAYQDKLIDEHTTIIEPTSGNTGIGLAIACAIYGNKLILTMPETMSIERQKLLKAYGANLVLTEGKKGMQGAVDKANALANEIENSFIPGQFVNPNNPLIHTETTALEIIDDFNDKIDYFVAGIGTGGTITGVSKVLKEKYPEIKISIKDGTHDTISANNINDVTDIMIGDQRKAFSDRLNNVYIGDLYYSIKISNANNLSTKKALTINDLKDQNCIVIASREEFAKEIEFMKTKLGYDGDCIYATTLTEANLMVAANIGFLPVASKQKEKIDDGSIATIPLLKNNTILRSKLYSFYKKLSDEFTCQKLIEIIKDVME